MTNPMKSDLFDEIALYDIVHVPGIATDLNHIDTRARVSGHLPENSGLKTALKGADIIVVTAGIARKPGMTRDGKNCNHHPIFIRLTNRVISDLIMICT